MNFSEETRSAAGDKSASYHASLALARFVVLVSAGCYFAGGVFDSVCSTGFLSGLLATSPFVANAMGLALFALWAGSFLRALPAFAIATVLITIYFVCKIPSLFSPASLTRITLNFAITTLHLGLVYVMTRGTLAAWRLKK